MIRDKSLYRTLRTERRQDGYFSDQIRPSSFQENTAGY